MILGDVVSWNLIRLHHVHNLVEFRELGSV